MDNLEQLIANYQPTKQTAELVSRMKIVLFVGISGAGKDTIKSQLLKTSDYLDLITCTTRAPRTNDGVPEVEGRAYYFIDKPTAIDMIESRQYAEVSLVHGEINGSSIEELQRLHALDKIALADIDVQGLAKYKKLSESIISIFILPPDYTTWLQRLKSRYSTPEAFEAAWPKRRASAIRELTQALGVSYYHFVINDEIDRAVRIVDEIARRDEIFHRKDDEARLRARDLLAAIQMSS